jgi:uncharacterized protein YndB with AHSA1/START domain
MTGPASVRLVEVFDAPRERVFAAWTEAEQLKRWWGPGRYVTTMAQVDLRPGGRYELMLEPGSMHLVGEFREVVAPERLVYTWRWESGVPDRRESLVTVEFHDLGERTELVLLHDNFAGPGPVHIYDAGWASGLRKLAVHLGSEEAA